MKPIRLAVIFPAFNEGKMLASTISGVRKTLASHQHITADLIVVDDGSTDQTYALAQTWADVTLHHRLNRGLGGALSTGITYVKRQGIYDALITFDSDGQHNPNDIVRAVALLQKGSNVVIGSRFLNPSQRFPKWRKYILMFSNLITYLLFQVKTTDSQSGFRALDQAAFSAITLSTNRMEVSSEVFAEIKRHELKLVEMPITIAYTPYSLAKGQSNLNSFSILVKLLYKAFH